ncbi:tRNA:m(4)X modification enzyme TRM13 homolog isoform X2 [Stegodyphus dumicola]|uniref:tRNA:m(4)X modification enzyme TRM13 homolog isoform X2 n=1 Tax=Stegodyphus dumicola TaxID=202533 RepID=UPI0015A8EECA|nr:tRNA:m(4)X modification enzyme TRM13 homolog isoform X2 [Stegodyphus dumicola]
MSKRSAEEENVCSFFLERKKRLCRMKTGNGMNFCPHHSHLGSDLNEKKGARVPCPLDSSHFCYESKLQKHLKKCNAREKEKPAYFVQNINAPDFNISENNKLYLIDVPDEELLCLVEKVKTLYNETDLHIHDSFTLHPILQAEMQNVDDGLCSFKHMKQQASLLAVLENFNLLADGTCFLEFGAGKGQLMYWIIKCVPDSEKPAFILVDKSAQRHKSDNKFKGCDLLIQRIRIDIQHLHIGKIESIAEKLNKVVGVSKHLCGAATDLALKCLMDTLEVEQNEEKLKHKALGMVMALCCHQQMYMEHIYR